MKLSLSAYGLAGLRLESAAAPTPNPGEVIIEAQYASVNPVDLETINGDNKMLLPLRPSFVPGVDAAGVVHAVGAQVQGFAVKDRVAVYTGVPVAGCFQRYIRVPAEHVARVPDGLELQTAAALSLAGLAGKGAFEALELDGPARVLIHGAAGSVGGAAFALAVEAGHEVIAHVHSRDAENMRARGAAQVLCYDKVDFADHARDLDAVVDTRGKDVFKKSIRITRSGGVISSVCAIPRLSQLRQAGFTPPALLSPLLRLMQTPDTKKGRRLRPVVTEADGASLQTMLEMAAAGRYPSPKIEGVALPDLVEALKTKSRNKIVVSIKP